MKQWPFVLAVFCSIAIFPLPCLAEAEDLASAVKEQLSITDHYRRALTVDPDNPTLHYFLGMTLLTEGQNQEAIAEFRQAYSAFIDSTEMNYNLGLAYARTGDPDSALLYFDEAEALGALEQPGLFPLANAYYNLGLTYLEADAFEEAARLFSKTLALDPDRQEIHRLLGEIYARTEEVERALDEFHSYLKIYPDDAAAREYVYTLHFNRAQQFLENSDNQEARNAFNNALAANPGSPLALYYLGYLDYTEGQYEEAADRLAKVYHASPAEIRQSMDSILYNSALALFEQQKFREALAAVEPLTARQPATLKDLYLAGNIHLALKEFEPARTCFKRVLALDPSHRGATMNMVAAQAGAVEELFAEGRALFRQGEYADAQQKLEAALAMHPAHPGARVYMEETRAEIEKGAADLFDLADELLRQKNPHEALKQLKSGLNLAPDSPRGLKLKESALNQLARELAKSLEKGIKLAEEGLLKEADLAFVRVLELDPANEQAWNGRTRIAHLLEARASEIAARGTRALEDGRLAEAREAFEAALKLVPELREGKDGLARIEVLLTAMISEEVQWGRGARSAGRLRQAREHFANALRLRDSSELREEMDAIDRSLMERIFALIDAAWQSLEKDDFKRARNYFEQALAQSPQHPDAIKGLAEVEARSAAAVEGEITAAEEDLATQNFHRALARYRRALDIDPTNKKARRGLDQGLKMMEGELVHLISTGNEALADGLFEEAETSFLEALALDPYRREAQAALRRLEQLRDSGIKPGDEQRIYLHGIELYTRGKYEEAVTAWERVLILSPGHEKARLNIEKARRKLQQIQEYHNG